MAGTGDDSSDEDPLEGEADKRRCFGRGKENSPVTALEAWNSTVRKRLPPVLLYS